MNMLDKVKKFSKENLWIWPIFVGVILRLYKLTASSIWHDEGYTMWLLKYDFTGIIERTARDVHPPGYYLMVKPWVIIFGNSELAIRMLSVLFSLGIIYFAYRIIEILFSKKEAFWGSLFVALSPFMVRFAQEARMYGVVAFFTTLGTYFLIRFIKEKQNKFLIPYLLSMIVAIYTQYYAFFVVISHWIIIAIATPGFFTFKWKESLKSRFGIFNPYFLVANLAVFICYLPWFPVAYRQVTRVSTSYWIKPEWINLRTIPNNVLQFISYDHLDALYYANFLGKLFWWIVVVVLIGIGFYLFKTMKNKKALTGLFVYGYLPMILVFTLSKLKTPVYQDRYFPFSAIAIFAIWGILVASIKNRYIKYILASALIVILLVGNYGMHITTDHQMKALSEKINSMKNPGDAVVAGELYTFLDGTYYFSDKNIKLVSDPVDGYGESSLFYDQQTSYVISKNQARNLSRRIFVVGKTGNKDYFKSDFWAGAKSELIFEGEQYDDLKAVLYTH